MDLGTTPDLGQSHFRRIARMDLGLLTDLGQSHFRHSPRQTSGVSNFAPRAFLLSAASGRPRGGAFSQIGILSPLRTDLGLC